MTYDDDREGANGRLQEAMRQAAAKENALAKALSSRGAEPASGDLFRFPAGPSHGEMSGHAETDVFDWSPVTPLWLVLGHHEEDAEVWFAVQADDVPLVGTPDVPIPAEAMSGPLSVRCGLSLWIPTGLLKQARRVGVLEPLHLERVMEKAREIFSFELIGSPGMAETDADPDFQEWMRVAHAHHTEMMERIAGLAPVAERSPVPALADIAQAVIDRLRDAIRWDLDVAMPSTASGGIDRWKGTTFEDADRRQYRVTGKTVGVKGEAYTEVKVTQRFTPRRLMLVALELDDGVLVRPSEPADRWWRSGKRIVFSGVCNSKAIRGLRVILGEIERDT